MNLNQVKEKVANIIADVIKVKVDDVKKAKDFTELKIDDLDSVDIIVSLQKEFDIYILTEDVQTINTLNKLAEYVFGKLKKAERDKSGY